VLTRRRWWAPPTQYARATKSGGGGGKAGAYNPEKLLREENDRVRFVIVGA
jgi:hypothetical protein